MNLKIILKILIIFGLVILQVTLMPRLSIFHLYPNLLLITALILIIIRENNLAFLTAGLGGLILDFYSQWRFGFYTIIFLILVFSFNILMEQIFSRMNRILMIISIFVIILVYELISFYLAKHSFSFLILIDSLYSMILAYLIFLILKMIIKEPQNSLI